MKKMDDICSQLRRAHRYADMVADGSKNDLEQIMVAEKNARLAADSLRTMREDIIARHQDLHYGD